MKDTILVIDDDEGIVTLIATILTKAGYEVTTLTRPETLDVNILPKISLIILDVMMPVIDGFTLCEKIRPITDCPIIFLTAKSEEADLVEGFSKGADDYLQKPFRKNELLARIAAHLRREGREKTHVFLKDGIAFHLLEKEVLVQDTPIGLTKSEYEITELLAKNAGQVFSKEHILTTISDYDSESDVSAIVEHIKNIRAKFRKVDKDIIETVWGVGYKWKK